MNAGVNALFSVSSWVQLEFAFTFGANRKTTHSTTDTFSITVPHIIKIGTVLHC